MIHIIAKVTGAHSVNFALGLETNYGGDAVGGRLTANIKGSFL